MKNSSVFYLLGLLATSALAENLVYFDPSVYEMVPISLEAKSDLESLVVKAVIKDRFLIDSSWFKVGDKVLEKYIVESVNGKRIVLGLISDRAIKKELKVNNGDSDNKQIKGYIKDKSIGD